MEVVIKFTENVPKVYMTNNNTTSMLTNEEIVNVSGAIGDTEVKPVVSKAVKVVKTATKPPKPLTAREKNFTLNIIKGMNQSQAYENAGYKASHKTAMANASRLLSQDKIKHELVRLQKTLELSTIKDFHQPFVERFPNAMRVLDDLANNGNDYVKLSAVKEVLDRVSPKVTRNESIKVTITDKEKARRMKVLGITDVTSVGTVQPAQLEKPL